MALARIPGRVALRQSKLLAKSFSLVVPVGTARALRYIDN